MTSQPDVAAESEQTLWKGSSSQFLHFGTYLLCVLFFLLIVAMFIAARGVIEKRWLTAILFFWLIVPIFIAVIKWIKTKCRVYEVTTERIKLTRGVFSRQTEQVELYRLRDYTVVEPFWLRMFGLGNIVLTSADDSTPALTIEAVRQASDLRDQIRNHVEIQRDRKRVRVTEFE